MARINFQSMDLFRDIQEDQNLFYSWENGNKQGGGHNTNAGEMPHDDNEVHGEAIIARNINTSQTVMVHPHKKLSDEDNRQDSICTGTGGEAVCPSDLLHCIDPVTKARKGEDDTSTGICVQCVENKDCPPNHTCEDNVCTPLVSGSNSFEKIGVSLLEVCEDDGTEPSCDGSPKIPKNILYDDIFKKVGIGKNSDGKYILMQSSGATGSMEQIQGAIDNNLSNLLQYIFEIPLEKWQNFLFYEITNSEGEKEKKGNFVDSLIPDEDNNNWVLATYKNIKKKLGELIGLVKDEGGASISVLDANSTLISREAETGGTNDKVFPREIEIVCGGTSNEVITGCLRDYMPELPDPITTDVLSTNLIWRIVVGMYAIRRIQETMKKEFGKQINAAWESQSRIPNNWRRFFQSVYGTKEDNNPILKELTERDISQQQVEKDKNLQKAVDKYKRLTKVMFQTSMAYNQTGYLAEIVKRESSSLEKQLYNVRNDVMSKDRQIQINQNEYKKVLHDTQNLKLWFIATVISIVLVCFSLISKTLSFRITIIMVVSIYVVALILSQKLRVVGDREIHKHDTLVYPSITDRQKKKIAEATPECNDTSKPNGTCTVTKFEEREENADCQTNEHCI